MKLVILAAMVVCLSSCVQENNPRNLRLGNITIGQQLIDLKEALDKGAVSESEYNQIKENLVSASSMCAAAEQDDDEGWLF